MSGPKQLHLGAFMRPVSIHSAAWRYPGAFADANFNFKHYQRFAKKLEAGCFDFFFMADSLAVLNMPIEALRRSATVTSFEPLTLLSALSVVTERLGLVATCSTSYNEPYHVARKFASLDHISGGRAGWNVVTSGNPLEALNFGREEHYEHDERYRRAREFFEVVTGLWDSFADDAFIRNAETGIYFDPEKMHALHYEGQYYKVRGPLNIARPIQGWPVIVQAGASEAGRQLAAETAEVAFAGVSELKEAKAYRDDLHQRMRACGRDPALLKVMPGVFVVVGDTVASARAKKAKLDSLVYLESGIATLSVQLGYDVSGLDLDSPLPKDIPETNASRSSRQKLIEKAKTENMTVRQLAQYVGGALGSLELIGTAQTIADEMEKWLLEGACDGFNLLFPYLPQGLDDVVDQVVPELQRRGLFRREYAGKTLREHLGLPRPKNQFFD